MGRENRDMNPVILKIGIALAFSLGGMLFTFIRNNRSKPSKSSSDHSKSADRNNQRISRRSLKSEHHASHDTTNSCRFDPLATDKHIVECIKRSLITNTEAATFIQAALAQILEKATDDFFVKTINILQKDADMCYERLKEIPCFTCLQKPQGSLFLMVKLDFSKLQGINDDLDFCSKLAIEESARHPFK